MCSLRSITNSGVKLKLVMMSATTQVKKICDYFGTIGQLNVPGRMFQVEVEEPDSHQTGYHRKPGRNLQHRQPPVSEVDQEIFS